MHQVIMNLCTNAGHAMQEDGGVLEVSLANMELDALSVSKHLDLSAGSYLRLTVSDTGYGIPSEVMQRIFDPYFTTKDTGEGTGLGLSVAQGIVKAHGGTISVYSEPSKGTTFHVYLPLIQEKGREEREEKKPEEPLPTGSERILFVDDEVSLVEIGSQMLERLGYEVVTKRSSVQALARLSHFKKMFNSSYLLQIKVLQTRLTFLIRRGYVLTVNVCSLPSVSHKSPHGCLPGCPAS